MRVRATTDKDSIVSIAQAAVMLGIRYPVLLNKVNTMQVPTTRAYGARYIERAYVRFVLDSRQPRTNLAGVEL